MHCASSVQRLIVEISHNFGFYRASAISILTRETDIAILSVCPSVCPSVRLSVTYFCSN